MGGAQDEIKRNFFNRRRLLGPILQHSIKSTGAICERVVVATPVIKARIWPGDRAAPI
jgi:hypothetical protein